MSRHFKITKDDLGRYVRRISTGDVGRIECDPGNDWLHPSLLYEWEHARCDFEYVAVTTETSP